MPEPDCLMPLVSGMLALGDDHDAGDLALGGRQGLLGGGMPRRVDRGDGAGGEGKDQNQVFRAHGVPPGYRWAGTTVGEAESPQRAPCDGLQLGGTKLRKSRM